MGILTQGILNLDLGTNVPRQPYSTRPLSHIYIYITEWSTKVEIQNPLSEDPLRIRTPINTDTMDTFLCPEAQTLSTLLFTGTGYLRTVCFPCHNHVLFVDILHCPNNDRFLGLSSRIAWYVWFYVSLSFRVLYSHLIITTQVSLPWLFRAVIVPTLLPLCLS